MTFFGARRTPREWTAHLAARLSRAPGVMEVRAEGPLRLAVRYDRRGPFALDVRASYEAYQREHAGSERLLDATAAAIVATLARVDDPPTWEETRDTLLPWLLRPDEAGGCMTAGVLGGLAVAFAARHLLTGTRTLVRPPAWGVAPETLRRRALDNLQRLGPAPTFVPLANAPGVLRLCPADEWVASRVLLPAVRRAIVARIGSPVVVWLAARDAVFVCAPNVLGDPPLWLAHLPAIRAALASADALADAPILIHDDRLVRRERDERSSPPFD